MMANGNYRPPPQYGCVVGAFIMLLALVVLVLRTTTMSRWRYCSAIMLLALVVLVLRALHTLHHPAYLGH